MQWLLTKNTCPTCKDDYRSIRKIKSEETNSNNPIDFNQNLNNNSFRFIYSRGYRREERGRGRGGNINIRVNGVEEEVIWEVGEEEILEDIMIEIFIIMVLEDKEEYKVKEKNIKNKRKGWF